MAEKSTFSVDWEVDKHRENTESEEQWKLRKLFMELNKGEYPEQHLAELSKVFIYMHFYDYQYSAPITAAIRELSKNIPRDNYPQDAPGPSGLQSRKKKRPGSKEKSSKQRKK